MPPVSSSCALRHGLAPRTKRDEPKVPGVQLVTRQALGLAMSLKAALEMRVGTLTLLTVPRWVADVSTMVKAPLRGTGTRTMEHESRGVQLVGSQLRDGAD